MNFFTGQKLICVDGKFDKVVLNFMRQFPEEGKTYAVRGVQLGLSPLTPTDRKRKSRTKLLLVGVVNPSAGDGKEHGFNSERFRPLNANQVVNLETAKANE